MTRAMVYRLALLFILLMASAGAISADCDTEDCEASVNQSTSQNTTVTSDGDHAVDQTAAATVSGHLDGDAQVNAGQSSATNVTNNGNGSAQTSDSAATAATVTTGSGKDTVNVGNAAGASVQQSSGDATSEVNQQASLDVDVDTGSGDDSVATVNSSDVSVSGGDQATSNSEANTSVDIAAGDGNDTVSVANSSSASQNTSGDPASSSASSSASVDATIDGGDGDDSITVDNSSTASGDDGSDVSADANMNLDISGGAGNDTVTVTNSADTSPGGTASGTVGGMIDGGDGDDSLSLAAAGTQAENLQLLGGAGNDTIHNAADGTNVVIDGGADNDLITNSGALPGTTLVGGDGDDTVMNSGVVDGVDLGAGDDLMVVQTGSGVNGVMDGGAGTDTLQLAVDAGQITQDEADALAADIAQAIADTQATGGGMVTISGQVYTWTNFESLVNLISWAIFTEQSRDIQVSVFSFSDGRLNAYDAGAPVAVYCTGNGIEVWGIDAATGAGTPVLSAAPGVAGTTSSAFGQQLTILPDGMAHLSAPAFGGGVYNFSFNSSACQG